MRTVNVLERTICDYVAGHQVNISELTKNPANPRVIKDEKFARLKKSIQEFPQMMDLRPIVIDDEGLVLGGNMRLEALKALGHKTIPDEWVKKASDLTPEQKQEFIIKDNNSFGEYDWDVLANSWSDLPLSEWGVDIPEDWSPAEVVEEDEAAVGEMIDRAAELQVKWDTKSGQLWEIASQTASGVTHRLMCGSSTEKADVAALCGDVKPFLMVTDPPYGVEYDPEWRHEAAAKGLIGFSAKRSGKVENDDRVDWAEAWQLFEGDVAYVWHASLFGLEVNSSLSEADFELRSQIIWAKDSFSISRGHYHWQHESCFYAVRKGKQASWAGDRSQTTLWKINKNDGDDQGTHGTQKPLECMARPIRNHEGDVYEPFAGSGTTIVAAEQNKRACYAMEISPAYVAVCLERLTALGLTPKLTNG